MFDITVTVKEGQFFAESLNTLKWRGGASAVPGFAEVYLDTPFFYHVPQFTTGSSTYSANITCIIRTLAKILFIF
jgi:hypothetical protein